MAKKKILIIDDEEMILKVVSRVVEDMGHQPLTAFDGISGFEKAKLDHPDLILLDIMMPKLDGKATLKALKADSATKDIPVVMLTAKDNPEDIVDSLVDGQACDYIIKPFFPKDLAAKIDQDINDWQKNKGKLLGEDIELRIRKALYKM